MTHTVLVSGASGIVGYGALRALRKHPEGLRLIGTTIYDDSVAPAFSDLFLQAPATDAPGYIDWLLDVIRQHDVKLLVPGIEADLYHWTDHAEAIRATGAKVVLNNPELVHLCRDKWQFYEALVGSELSCAIPTSLDADFDALVARFGTPLLVKPRRGFASKGISRVSDRVQFDRLAEQIGPILMVQPLIGTDDAEYTTSAFGDGQGGCPAMMTLRRRLSRDGYTEKAEVVSSEPFATTTRELCARFSPLGPTNFQYRLCDTGVRLLEINPRVSSSTSIRTAFGYNECAMAVDFYLHARIPEQPKVSGGKAVRYTEDCIFHEPGLHF